MRSLRSPPALGVWLGLKPNFPMRRIPRSADKIRTCYQLSLTQAQYSTGRAQRKFSASSSLLGSHPKYPFPAHANPTPHEILGLPLDASASDIKKRYFELTKAYHPDTLAEQDMPEDVAYKRFCAVRAAYTALQEPRQFSDSNHFSDDLQAEEIKKRLATWGAAGSRLSPLEKVRRERALDAERAAGKWWRTDITLYYLIGGAVIAVAFMQFQARSTSNQKERIKRYIEMRQVPVNSTLPRKDI